VSSCLRPDCWRRGADVVGGRLGSSGAASAVQLVGSALGSGSWRAQPGSGALPRWRLRSGLDWRGQCARHHCDRWRRALPFSGDASDWLPCDRAGMSRRADCEGVFLLAVFGLSGVCPRSRSDAVRIYWPYVKLLQHLPRLFDISLQWGTSPSSRVEYASSVLVLRGAAASALLDASFPLRIGAMLASRGDQVRIGF